MGYHFYEDAEGASVDVTDIDSAIQSTKVRFIKMDVEGCELKALQGASKVIERDHLLLAISAYHREDDLIELSKYINSFNSSSFKYDLFLRHHGICAYELVLYAIPKQRRL